LSERIVDASVQFAVGGRVSCFDAPGVNMQAVVGSQDAVGGGIEVHNLWSRLDNDDSVPDDLGRFGKGTTAVHQLGEVVLCSESLLQVGDQAAHQLHALRGSEGLGAWWGRHDETLTPWSAGQLNK
jgi:hypothetical protein